MSAASSPFRYTMRMTEAQAQPQHIGDEPADEIDAKVVRSETIRAVRIILGAVSDAADPPVVAKSGAPPQPPFGTAPSRHEHGR